MKRLPGRGQTLSQLKKFWFYEKSSVDTVDVTDGSVHPNHPPEMLQMELRDRPGDKLLELKAGVRSLPYLADHGFHNMKILPGSFSIETARLVHAELCKDESAILRKIEFENPVILPAEEDIVITLRVRADDGGRTEYTFYEAAAADVRMGIAPRYFARLEIHPEDVAGRKSRPLGFSAAEFLKNASTTKSSAEFYQKLWENGNEYGPRFQNLSAIWTAGSQAVGKLNTAGSGKEAGLSEMHAAWLDAVAQLLSAPLHETGRTFVLKSVEKIEIVDLDFPDTLWVHATILAGENGDEKGCLGNVRVFDESGKLYVEVSSVALAFLERPGSTDREIAARTNICVASTFTAEPLEDSINFWGHVLATPVYVQFAPYNQVFQQLLDPGSLFHQNRSGVNVIVLSFDDWMEGLQPSVPKMREGSDRSFGNHRRYVLPNGLEIVHLNQYETDYLFREIFDDQCYFRHGIRLKNGDTVVDIGANIGLFSLFVMSRCENPSIYAFEPSEKVFELLEANCKAYGERVHVFNCGVSDCTKTAQFTFYENLSVFSSFHADEREDRDAVQAIVQNMLQHEMQAESESLDDYVNELTAERLNRRISDCRMTSVSDIIRENSIDRINLLKIDAEKSESDVIKGIEEQHWPIIDQIVVEIHDKTRVAVKSIERTFSERGYHCAVVEEKLLEDSGLINIYATRHQRGKAVETGSRPETNLLKRVDEFCAALHSFSDQSAAPLVVAVVPSKALKDHDTGVKAVLAEAEQELMLTAGKIPNVHVIDSASLSSMYPVPSWYAPHGRELGHIAYTTEGYAAIGTTLFRRIFKLGVRPFKVIVLDCDNTLWKGICGEDGPLGIELTEPYRLLQELMIEQMNSGLLICLCSKNSEEDVLEVFARRKDMVLRREHLAAWRINWDQKSKNIQSLASELDLGLDSLIFIDDNPVECAEVRANCPDVLVLQLPRESESIIPFLTNVWVFDRLNSTDEDRQRTRWHQENIQREKSRGTGLSLKDFLDGLQLRVDVEAPTEDQLHRVSQLTQRTNQFNFSTIRRSEGEIRNLLKDSNTRCLRANVSDRFGDYGLVGVLLYEVAQDHYKVDTFLLSCRALGKGVEYRMLSELGKRAEREGKNFVEVVYVQTERNQPAFEFINGIGIGNTLERAGGLWFRLPVSELAALRYEPYEGRPLRSNEEVVGKPKLLGYGVFDTINLSEKMQEIGDNIHNINQISAGIAAFRLHAPPPLLGDFAPPGDPLEAALATIWKRVLGRAHIGINDNFFDAGGTSLKAVLVAAAIRNELKQSISVTHLFESPTVKLLAAKLESMAKDNLGVPGAGNAGIRGRQRRQKLLKRDHAG